jgi:hypothetical protein
MGLLGLMLLCPGLVRAQEKEKDVPWQALDEIARRGNLVERIDGFQDAGDASAAIAAALATPADDSHKWHFTLVTKQGCAACAALKRDFDGAPALKPWVNTADYKKSWAHWQVIDADDATQAWRWKDFKPSAYPTLIVQPPFNGGWGDPHVVVFLKTGYDGRPEKLTASIKAAIEKYAVAVFARKLAADVRRGAAPHFVQRESESGMRQQGGWTPPFSPVSPQPAPAYQPLPQIPPDVAAQPPGNFALWTTLILGGLGLGGTNAVGVGLAAWALLRKRREARGDAVLPQATYDRLHAALEKLAAKTP